VSEAEVVGGRLLVAGTVEVPVAVLAPGSHFRADGLCEEQVDRLVSLDGAWPPIVVGRDDGVVVDGAHRVEAARRLGLPSVVAVPFDGGADEQFVEFVRRNVSHGLLLTLGYR
jgi:hypothetical protein